MNEPTSLKTGDSHVLREAEDGRKGGGTVKKKPQEMRAVEVLAQPPAPLWMVVPCEPQVSQTFSNPDSARQAAVKLQHQVGLRVAVCRVLGYVREGGL